MPKAKTPEPDFRFELDGEVLEYTLDDMTFGEAEEIEVYFDKPMSEIDFASGRGLMFIAYLARKRKRKSPVSLDEFRGLKVDDLKEAPAKRPTKAESATSGTQSSENDSE